MGPAVAARYVKATLFLGPMSSFEGAVPVRALVRLNGAHLLSAGHRELTRHTATAGPPPHGGDVMRLPHEVALFDCSRYGMAAPPSHGTRSGLLPKYNLLYFRFLFASSGHDAGTAHGRCNEWLFHIFSKFLDFEQLELTSEFCDCFE